MATQETENSDNDKLATFIDSTVFAVFPSVMVLICAVAATISDTPQKWLVRAAVWLMITVARYFAARG